MFLATLAYGLARVTILLYTCLSLPIYALIQCPCLKEDGSK